MAENAISTVFNMPGIAGFTLLRSGVKFPPIEEGWQKKGHSFEEAMAHRGNIGLLAGNGYIGLDQDKPEAFNDLTLSSTTTWETRPGRLGMWFKCNDRTPEVLAKYGFKKPDHAQIKLYDGRKTIDSYHPHIGEIKLERTYQVLPPSWKIVDGQRVDYKMLEEVPPAEISLDWLLSEMLRIGIVFSEKPKAPRYEANAKKLEGRRKEAATRKRDKTTKAREFLLEAGMGAKPGHRNDKGFWLACQLRDLGLDAGEASEYMCEYAKALSNSEAEPYTEDEAMESLKQAYSRTPRELPTSQTRQESKALKEPRPESQTSETEAEKHRREHAEANPSFLRADADRFEAENPGCKIFNCDDDPKQGEISEEEAKKYTMPSNPKLVLNLEPDNFLTQYVAYGNELSDAYPDYFFMNGLEMLAIINDRKTYVHLGVKKIYPNVYINQLGASTTAHKSTAMDDNEACIEELNDGQYHSAPSDGSPEGWLEGMAEDGSHAYCNQDEVANYLARMHKHDYMAGMTDILNKVFDGATINKRNARKKGNQPSRWTIKDPYYNQLYATTAEKFSFVTTSMDVHSGFWVRFLHSYPNYDRDKFTPLREASDSLLMLQQRIIGRLRSIQAEIAPLEDVKVKIEPEGWKLYEAWQIRWNRRLRKTSDDYIKQIIGRYTVYVLKLGMLFTMGRADFDRTNVVISAAHIKEATRLIDEYFIPHALAVRDLIGEGAAKDTNLIVKVESVLRVNGGQIVHRLLLKKTKVSAKQLDEALDTMVKSGTIDIKIVKNPRGRATEKIFLRQDDESIMSILSTTEGQYENRDD